MRLHAASSVPLAAALRSVRGNGAAVLAGLGAMATVLALGAHVLTSPDAAETSAAQTVSNTAPGGETVVAKFAQADTPAEAETVAAPPVAEPTPTSRLLAMALAPTLSLAPSQKQQEQTKEPSLEGLSEIPPELIWNRPEEEDKPKPKAFADFSEASEQLPWDAVEPVPFSPLKPAPTRVRRAEAKPQAATTPHRSVPLPGTDQVEGWVKAKVTEIKGAARSRPLYHFELWLEPPAAVKRRLVGVTYAFSTPAVRPQSQASSDQASGFRISAGGLACADEIDVTLRFDDGRSHTVALDGCELLS